MIRRPPRSTRTDTLLPYTTLFRSGTGAGGGTAANVAFQANPVRVDNLHPRATELDIVRPNQYYNGTFVPEHDTRSEEHTSELQSLMRISYAVFCLKKKTTESRYINEQTTHTYIRL